MCQSEQLETRTLFILKQLQQTERKLAEQEGVVSYERHRNTGIDLILCSKEPPVSN